MFSVPTCDLYLRLSDARIEEALDGRETKLRSLADALGWVVFRVVIENDMIPGTDGKMRPASAFKRRKIVTPSGRKEMRVVRPGFRDMLDDIISGRINGIIAEDLDRTVRDPRDLEDLIDACQEREASARSLSGSLTLTNGGTDAEVTMARMMVTMANKASRDTRRRVTEKNEILHGQSYRGGGRRPYGFTPAQDTTKYHRNLLIVPDEAEVLRRAADDILNKDVSLMAVARELREQGIPTVTGAQWTPATIRNALLKPSIAGLAPHKGRLKPAPWPAILDQDVWEKLKGKLEDPTRRTTTGNEPKWLLSGIARCGVCDDGTTVKASGSDLHNSGVGYTCPNSRHLRRSARYADSFIEQLVIARLSKTDIRDILRPPVIKGIDVGRLRNEVKDLRKRKEYQMRMHASGMIDDDDLATGMREIRDRLLVAEAQLGACDEPDPLAEFRDKPADAVWRSLSLPRKRAIVKLLVDITFLPIGHRGPGFDPKSVAVVRKV